MSETLGLNSIHQQWNEESNNLKINDIGANSV